MNSCIWILLLLCCCGGGGNSRQNTCGCSHTHHNSCQREARQESRERGNDCNSRRDRERNEGCGCEPPRPVPPPPPRPPRPPYEDCGCE